MNIPRYLIKSRGPVNAIRRLSAIGGRFGVSTARMERALQEFSRISHRYGCRPTLAVTAVLLERYPDVFRRLDGQAELAIHGYVHTDYKLLDEASQAEHMERALRTFQGLEISPRGFRCPYLRWNDDSFRVAERFGLRYGSNRALAWDDHLLEGISAGALAAYHKGLRLYDAKEASARVSLPSRVGDSLLDIPASLPDDEAMVDRLRLDAASREAIWTRMLDKVHSRGELLTLILHHERVAICGDALAVVLARAGASDPPVWIASLGQIADWWSERASWRLSIEPVADGGYRVVGPEAAGATLVVRGMDTEPAAEPWFGAWRRVPAAKFLVRSPQAPVAVVERGSPSSLVDFLHEEGFAVRDEAAIPAGGLPIPGYSSFHEEDKRGLIDFIEGSDAPLVRLWRWPNAARSALSVTGDVDAMTLLDFLRRPLEV